MSTYGAEPDETHAAGGQVTGLKGDVEAAGTNLATALGAVSAGSEHGGGKVDAGAVHFKTWAEKRAGNVATGVKNLGDGTKKGAETTQDANNDATSRHNGSTSTAQSTTSNLKRPVAAS